MLALAASLGACSASPEEAQDTSAASTADRGNKAYCATLPKLVLSDGAVKDDSGDGVLSPGETAIVSFTVTNVGADPTAVSSYPGVHFTFDPPVAALTDGEGPDGGFTTMTHALLVDKPYKFHFRIQANDDAAPGNLKVTAAMADNVSPFTHCAHDGPPGDVSVTVGKAQ